LASCPISCVVMMALGSLWLQQQVKLGDDVYVFKLGCNSDGTALAAATSEHALCLLDPTTLQVAQQLEGHGDVVEDVSFFQAAPSLLTSCSHDGTARVWDARAATALVRTFPVSSNEVYSCSVGRGDTALACAASEKVHLFDVAEGKRLRVYKDCHTDVVNHVRFHPVDTTKLLTGAEDNLVTVLDTNAKTEDAAMLTVIPNEECVRSFTLVGPGRDVLCCASTTEDVRIWGLGESDCGVKKAEFLGLRGHPLLSREESGGYVVETFYDQVSSQVFLLAGAGDAGDLVMFQVSLTETTPIATFCVPSGGLPLGGSGHTGIVRSALCLTGGTVITAGEDGCVCAWREVAPTTADAEPTEQRFGLEPTSYGAQRASESRRAAPY